MAIASSAIGGMSSLLRKQSTRSIFSPCAASACGRGGHARVAALAQDLGWRRGLTGHDAVAVLLHVLGREEARPVPLRRQADHGDGVAGAQDAAQGGDVAHGGSVRKRAVIAADPRSTRPWTRISRMTSSWRWRTAPRPRRAPRTAPPAPCPARRSTYTGTPLRPSWASAAVMAGSRRVQSARSRATFLAAKSASTSASASVVFLLYWQVTHQAAVKSTNTGWPGGEQSGPPGRAPRAASAPALARGRPAPCGSRG